MEKGYIGFKELKAFAGFLSKNTFDDYLVVGNGCVFAFANAYCVMVKTDAIPEDAPLVNIPGELIRNKIKHKKDILIDFDNLIISDLSIKEDITLSKHRYSSLRSVFNEAHEKTKQNFMNVNARILEKIAKFSKAADLSDGVTFKLNDSGNILVFWGGVKKVVMVISQHNMFNLKNEKCDLYVSELMADFDK